MIRMIQIECSENYKIIRITISVVQCSAFEKCAVYYKHPAYGYGHNYGHAIVVVTGIAT